MGLPMSLLSRLLAPKPQPLSRLWAWIVATARQPDWYLRHRVADTVDGRFDMVALVASLVLLELEARGRDREVAVLTERFVEDMDGSLREMGIGDLVVGKHMGRMIGALGGRLGSYRQALAETSDEALVEALSRNVYRDPAPEGAKGKPAPEGAKGKPASEGAKENMAPEGAAAALAPEVRALAARIRAASDDELLTAAL